MLGGIKAVFKKILELSSEAVFFGTCERTIVADLSKMGFVVVRDDTGQLRQANLVTQFSSTEPILNIFIKTITTKEISIFYEIKLDGRVVGNKEIKTKSLINYYMAWTDVLGDLGDYLNDLSKQLLPQNQPIINAKENVRDKMRYK